MFAAVFCRKSGHFTFGTSHLAVGLSLLSSATIVSAQVQQGPAVPADCGGLTGPELEACRVRAETPATPRPTATDSGELIVVTGSRIPRANFDTAQPAVVLGGEQIEQRGYSNLADAL
jgi:hypothetical protein